MNAEHGEQRVAADLAPDPATATARRSSARPQRSYDTRRSSSRICSEREHQREEEQRDREHRGLARIALRCSVS